MIHKHSPDKGFLRAVAVLLFAAVCAYALSWLFSAARKQLDSRPVFYESITKSTELYGIALRYEKALPPEGFLPLAEVGQRLPAGAAAAFSLSGEPFYAEGSAVYLEGCDGFEYLSPALLEELSPEKFEALLHAAAESPADGRLIYGHEWFFAAALPDGSEGIRTGRCILDFGFAEAEARLIRLIVSDGQTLAVFRLRELSPELLSLRQCTARLILERCEGWVVPKEAVRYDKDGRSFVRLYTETGLREQQIETVYEENDRFLVKAVGEGGFREGDRVFLPGREISSAMES